MSKNKGLINSKSRGKSYLTENERLNGTNAELTSFLFPHGANVYVFSYEKEGVRKHTFIDSGDWQYRNEILSILVENDINPANIERIILTHRHPDHCGLAVLLARESGAKILAHPNFKSFVEGNISQEERGWLRGLNPSQLKDCDIEYLSQADRSQVRSISGVDFPGLAEPIDIGDTGKLMIMTSPEATSTHSPDQIIILYSPRNYAHNYEEKHEDWRPTDDILFSGDLWLMRGPFHGWSFRTVSRRFRFGVHRMRNLITGKGRLRRSAREQDSKAKDALKRGFHLIRVKPGHGDEFIGSRIIPESLPADRDLLLELGLAPDTDKSILRRKDLAPRVATLREQAYTNLIKESLFWMELGYTLSEISAFLVRIYKEQSGGDTAAQKDRKERRARLKATLTRLKDDDSASEELHQLAEATFSALKKVS